MADKFYQVLAASADQKVQMLFSDLTVIELDKKFVKPYGWGQAILVLSHW
jgi:hypothetical protein